jgi:hypothetical protein
MADMEIVLVSSLFTCSIVVVIIIVVIVFVWGRGRWEGARSFSEMFLNIDLVLELSFNSQKRRILV